MTILKEIPNAEERYVAFCDVIGFKKIIFTEELRNVAIRYNNLIQEAQTIASNISIPKQNYFKEYKLNYTIFSDTLFAWSESYSKEVDDIWKYDHSFLYLVSLIFHIGFKYNLPFRIGIAYCDCVIHPDKNLYLGVPLINAYQTECIQKWIGIGCHNSCIESPIRSKLCFTTTNGNSQGLMIPYKVPIKNQCKLSLNYTLDWPKQIDDKDTLEEFIKSKINETRNIKYKLRWRRCLDYFRQRYRVLKDEGDSFIGGNYHSPI